MVNVLATIVGMELNDVDTLGAIWCISLVDAVYPDVAWLTARHGLCPLPKGILRSTGIAKQVAVLPVAVGMSQVVDMPDRNMLQPDVGFVVVQLVLTLQYL